MSQISFEIGALPAGFNGTPQEFANLIASLLIGVFPPGSVGINGQINGADPGNQNIGMWFNGVNGWYYFNTGTTSYTPDESQGPIGTPLGFTGPAAQIPTNFLVCDGASYLRATYPVLYARIGTAFGSADGTHFNVPKSVHSLRTRGSGARITGNLVSGAITSYNIVDGGKDYSGLENILVNGGGGTGATTTITVTNGVVTGITLTASGSGYISVPAVAFSGGGGSGAAATAIMLDGKITGFTITAGGSAYTTVPTITIDAPPAAVTATATVVTASNLVTGSIITANGSGYLSSSPPAVVISGGSGTGATAVAVVRNGKVIGIIITNPGSGYSGTPTFAIDAPPAVSTATATSVTTNGIITAVTPVANGSGYSTTPDVYVAACLAIIRAK